MFMKMGRMDGRTDNLKTSCLHPAPVLRHKNKQGKKRKATTQQLSVDEGVFTPGSFGPLETDFSSGADLLGRCEYKPADSGADQTSGPRPPLQLGLGPKRTLVRFASGVNANRTFPEPNAKSKRLFGFNRLPLLSENVEIINNEPWVNMEHR